MIGEFLYSISSKEAVSQPALQRVTVREVVSQALGAFVLEHDVSIERLFLLEHAWINGATAGVALVDDLDLVVRDRQLVSLFTLYSRFFTTPLANTRISSGTVQGVHGNVLAQPVLLMPGDKLLASFGFTAAAAGNIGSVHYSGILLPRGTMQYGSLTRTQ